MILSQVGTIEEAFTLGFLVNIIFIKMTPQIIYRDRGIAVRGGNDFSISTPLWIGCVSSSVTAAITIGTAVIAIGCLCVGKITLEVIR